MLKLPGINSRLAVSMNKLADLLILNILFLITCIPIITAGAAASALYSVMLKLVDDKESPVARMYFKAFSAYFKQATIIWLLLLLLGAILGMDFYLYLMGKVPRTWRFLNYIFLIVLVLYVITFSYVFPFLAQFNGPVKQTFMDSVLMGIRHLPYTMLLVILTFAGAIIFLCFPRTLPYILLAYLTAGFSVTAYFNSILYNRIFAAYEQKVI